MSEPIIISNTTNDIPYPEKVNLFYDRITVGLRTLGLHSIMHHPEVWMDFHCEIKYGNGSIELNNAVFISKEDYGQ